MDIYTFDEHKIERVIQHAICKKHKADIGDPCWDIYLSEGDTAMAVCNTRAKKAGFVGRISASSLSTKAGPRKNKP